MVSGGSGAAFPPSPAPPFRRRFTWSAWSAGEATPSSLHRRQLPSDASPAVPPPQRRPVAEAARLPVGRARLAFSSVPPCRVAAQRCKKQLPALCIPRRIAPALDCRLHSLITELASFGMEPPGSSGFLYILIHVSRFVVPINFVSNWFHY